jgi:hypothetical protein
MSTTTKQRIDFKRIDNDVNGNPRYVCHFLSVLPDYIKNGGDGVSIKYQKALKLAKAIGGKKFHNKQYGGGIVFQSYNIAETEQQINALLNK